MRFRLRIDVLLIASAAIALAQSNIDVYHSIGDFLRAGQNEQALEILRPQLGRFPSDVRLLTLDGVALSRVGKKQEAVFAFDRALKVNPKYVPALEGAAQLEFELGSNRAGLLLERLIALNPDEQMAHAMLATLAYKKHDCIQAAQHFGRAMSVISSEPLPLAQYGECLVETKRISDAIVVLRQLVVVEPHEIQAKLKLAALEIMDQRASDAVHDLEPLAHNPAVDPEVLDLLSAAEEAAGDTADAVQSLRKAITLRPDNVDYYLDFADLAFAHQSFQVGVDMINAGLQIRSDAAPLYAARGILLIQLGEYEQGQTDFETAERLNPRQQFGSEAKGLSEFQNNDLDKAMNTVKSQLRSSPDDGFLQCLLAEIILRRGVTPGAPESRQAIEAASRAARLMPNAARPHDVLGLLYLDSGDLDRAIEQCRLALQIDSSDQTALYHLITALRRSNKGEEIPALARRLAELREQSRKEEAAENRYRLIETPQDARAGSKDH